MRDILDGSDDARPSAEAAEDPDAYPDDADAPAETISLSTLPDEMLPDPPPSMMTGASDEVAETEDHGKKDPPPPGEATDPTAAQ